ncbi:hypothetical protein M3C10_01635 [Micrococcus luteus]|uniref:hypothetical protein n=1 Tax=Micrococcus TaxID=1269 RepID=UPI0006698846|nr:MULTISPECIES: hypothetical protein [Micrococcus]MBM4623061.1 hypothetical protein [Micrococcus sp. JV4]MCT1815416.1 hypothetical protein [Micrococcus luteus]MCV7458419.1 hypothetical protein [Micrococcus luteus]MCV7617425.1 hypothetical protein [Micrococcus luteus]MCV7642204.1 hypothetical protein [Micrococcus luteus]
MTALALLALGLHDLLDAVLPGAWPAPRRRWLARAGAAVAAALAAVLVAVLAPTGVAVAVGGGLVALGLLMGWTWLHPDRPLGVVAVVAAVGLVAVLESTLAPAGLRSAPPALTLLAVAVALTETGNRVTRAVLALAGRLADGGDEEAGDAAADGLRGGRYIGTMERLLMVVLGLAQAYPVIAALMAAKGIVRFPEISADRGAGSRAEEFLIGSLASWGLAAAGAVVVWLALGLTAPGAA